MADVEGGREQKKVLDQRQKFYYILPHKGRISTLLGSLFIEGKASPNISTHFCLLLVDVQSEKKYYQNESKSFHVNL